jgi:hypothetical protein
MRFVCGDVRVLIVSYKNDHGPSRCRYRALQWQRFLKICFREIYGVVRFSTFATISVKSGKAQCEHMTSAVHPTTDIDRRGTGWFRP